MAGRSQQAISGIGPTVASRSRRHRVRMAIASVVIGALGASYLVSTGQPAAANEAASAEPRECVRAAVVAAWESGGPQVKAAARTALLGDEAAVCAFVNERWAELEDADRSILANQMHADGGPSTKAAVTQALDADDPEVLRTFLESGWRDPWHADQEIRINQMVQTGGPQLRAAATRAIDAGSVDVLRQFLESGWEDPHHADLEVRVNQIHATGGTLVKQGAQRALDVGTVQALTRFVEVDWGVAAARDHERASLTDLLRAAKEAGAEAKAETLAAKEQADRAVAEADAARRAAITARDAANAAAGNQREAEVAAGNAARAAQQAAAAAQQAVGAANEAAAAAREASRAAVRVALAASLAQTKAAEASKAAAAARLDKNAAGAARDAARAARVAAEGANTAGAAIQGAVEALNKVRAAADAARSAGGHATAAEAAAREAAAAARRAGADASKVDAAAQRARAASLRAARAAAAAIAYADIAAAEAIKARNAALAAAANAARAATAAEDAAEHAGNAANAAALAREHAQAAEAAATAAQTAAEQAGAIYTAAREADRARLEVAHEQGLEAAREATRIIQTNGLDVPSYDQPQADWHTPAVSAALEVIANPGTSREVAVAKGREVALALVRMPGTWTSEAARDALAGDDEQILTFVRGGLTEAEGMDDRTTLAGLGSTGTPAMQAAIKSAAGGTDAQVSAFLRNVTYPERVDEDTLAVNRILAAARKNGDQHTVDAATHALDDGSANTLRAFVKAGQHAAREADEEIKVNQVLARAPEGSELRIAADIALQGPRAFRTKFIEQGQYQAALRDHDTAAHEEVVASLVTQAEEAASRALENSMRAWESAARAAGAAADAAAHAAAAEQAARDASAHATAAAASASRAHASANQAAASARTAISAAASAQRSATSAAQSATWARISLSKAQKFANEAIDSANEARRLAEEAGRSVIEAAAEYNRALGAAYRLMTDELLSEAEKATGTCRNPLLPGEFTAEGYNLDCLQDIADNTVELVEDNFDPRNLAYKQGVFCENLYGRGGPLFDRCLAHVLSPTFMTDVLSDEIGNLLDSIHAVVAGLSALLEQVAVWRFCKGPCKKLHRILTDDVLGYDTFSEWLFWSQVAAQEESSSVSQWRDVAVGNWNMVQWYFENSCFVPPAGLRAAGDPKHHHCAIPKARAALSQAGWTPRVYDVGGGFKASLSTADMVHVMIRHMWPYFGTAPKTIQTYFAPTDTIASVTGYLDRVVRQNAVGIREYLNGTRSSSQFTLEIDGYTYVLGMRRDGSIGQFYRK